MKLGLGSVQFGLDYGLAKDGMPNADAVGEILDWAFSNDVLTIDTAPSYGDSEIIIGAHINGESRLSVVTKTPHFSPEAGNAEIHADVIDSLHDSLKNLRQNQCYGLLVHNAEDLLANSGPELYKALEELKDEGLVEKIGVSVYSADQIKAILAIYDINLIQVPISIFDQRLVTTGWLDKLKERGIEIHARSIFLQGLALMCMETLPKYFDPVAPHLQRYADWLVSVDMKPLQGALGFIHALPQIDVALVGVNNVDHLRQIVQAMRVVKGSALEHEEYAPFAIDDETVVNPSLWPTAT